VGAGVGVCVGVRVGAGVGCVGATEGEPEGVVVGAPVGERLGLCDTSRFRYSILRPIMRSHGEAPSKHHPRRFKLSEAVSPAYAPLMCSTTTHYPPLEIIS
jgi:hypothetical protein